MDGARMSGRRRLLFVAPVMPAEGGNGLAMRAGLFLDALAADHDVSLLVVPVLGPGAPVGVPEFVTRRSVRTVVVPVEGRLDPDYDRILRLGDPRRRIAALRAYPAPALCRFVTPEAVRAAATAVGTGFDALHVMRLYLAPFAAPHLDALAAPGRSWASLDLDDDEPTTHRRLAALRALHAHGAAAALEAAEATKYEVLERRWLRRFGQVFVCSEVDRAAVQGRTGHERVEIVPNAVRIPAGRGLARPRSKVSAFRLLFVGSLGYFPNEDAALVLCREVLPRLRARAGRPVRVQLAGSRPPPAVTGLTTIPGVAVTADPPAVAPFYRAADAVIVPMRAGGGTRVKLLEAFAHRVPAVATSIAAEGLAVEAGRHLLVADDPDGLADACLSLMRGPGRAHELVARAARLVSSRYALPRVVATIRRLTAAPVAAWREHRPTR
jgi:glycosyltransferase involved in cell wall biosynthesis